MKTLKEELARKKARGLAVDIDETLSWTIGFWVAKMQEKFGNPEELSTEELIAKYRYTQNVPYWQTDEALQWMEEQRNSNEVQEVLPLIEGAEVALQEINKLIPVTIYLTTRPETVIQGTKNWLRKHHFPPAIIIARPSEVHIAEGNRWKAKVLEKLYPEIIGIIEDNPGLVQSLASDYKGTVYLYDNDSHPRHDISIVPCKSWGDVKSKLEDRHEL